MPAGANMHGGGTAHTPQPPQQMSHCADKCLIVLIPGVLQTTTMKMVVQSCGSGSIPGLDHVVGATPCRDGARERCRRGTMCVLWPAQGFRLRDGAGDLFYSEGRASLTKRL